MKISITMPALRPEMKSGILCAWLKNPGDPVKKGEPLFEIETEKVVNQVEAEQDGVLCETCIEEGDEAEVGKQIGTMEVGA